MKNQPTLSWELIRTLTENFSYEFKGCHLKGHNPPKGATNIQRVPYNVKYLTVHGHCESGTVITLKVFPDKQRMVQFVNSRQIRRIRDYLIMEIDGIRIITH